MGEAGGQGMAAFTDARFWGSDRPAAFATGQTKQARLILTVAAYFPDSYGGAERQAHILAQALGRRGVDVTLVAPTRDRDAPRFEVTKFGRVIRKYVWAYPNLGGRYLPSFIGWTVWFLYRFARQSWRGVPVYVFHGRLHAVGPALTAYINGAPLAIKLGGGGEASEFDALRGKKFLYGRMAAWFLLQRVNRFVANSRVIAEELHSNGVTGERVAQFPNGVELPSRAQIDDAIARRGGNRFVFTGRMVADKSVAVLYEAALAQLDSAERPQLAFLGDGPEKDRLSALVRTPIQEEAISFVGYVADVYQHLLAADFFVSASMREGQSNSLLEAMSAGVIPIVYNASGVGDVVQHGLNGFVVHESTPEAFATAMREAMTMAPERRRAMAKAARQFAEDKIGIAAIADTTISMIASIPAVECKLYG